MPDYPCFIDFEASGLATGTYPIEVAWSLPDGSVREYLIRPAPSWMYWDERSEEIHGIRRAELLEKGFPAAQICDVLLGDLVGREVFADGGLCDEEWLGMLLEDGERKKPTFRLCDCVPEMFFPEMPALKKNEIQQAAWQSVGKRHRAGNDVRWFIEYLRLGREAGFQDNVRDSVDVGKDEDIEEFLLRLRPRRP